jgi:hypothetical protein
MAKHRKANGNSHDKFMARHLDDLAAFEDFKDDLLPALQKLVKEGASAEDIYKKYESLAAARLITIVAKEVDSGKALSAIKDVLDRTQGKAKERHTHEHKYARLKDEELNSLLDTELAALEDEDAEGADGAAH